MTCFAFISDTELLNSELSAILANLVVLTNKYATWIVICVIKIVNPLLPVFSVVFAKNDQLKVPPYRQSFNQP